MKKTRRIKVSALILTACADRKNTSAPGTDTEISSDGNSFDSTKASVLA